MSTPKVHLVFESRFRFGSDPADWVTRCSFATSERISPEVTTRDPSKATCKSCQKIAAKTGGAS